MQKKRSTRYGLMILLLATVVVVTVSAGRVQARPTLPQEEGGLAPTYTIFATREGLVGKETANGHIIQPNDRFVALPSPSVLSSYQGNEYQVRITYKDRSVVVPVWDVGPWNIDDDYWSPNRRYSDLPVGVPMAQAAYLEGYNGGLDEFGRTIRSPNGIDIADGTFLIDLEMTRDDWVQVSFLWLGDDPGPGSAANILPPPTDGQQPVPPLNLPPPRPAANPATNPAPAPHDAHNMTGPPLDAPQVEAEATAVDNSDGGWNSSQSVWYTANCGLRGEHAWTYSTTDPSASEHHAIWRPTVAAGTYEVKAYIPPCGRANATRSARYRITYNGQVAEKVLDQQAAAGTWASLGTYEFGGPGAQLIELSDLTNDSEQSVRFDAIAWVPAGDDTPPEAQIASIEHDASGYFVSWSGTDDRSGVASYDVQVRQLPDGGWSTWRRGTTRTGDWFGPAEGKHFAFRVRARDQAGNEQPWPDQAGMDTMQVAQPPQP